MKHTNLLGIGNSKLRKTAKELDVKILNFSLPAYKSQSGKITCPFAKSCVKFCYAKKGNYLYSNVQKGLERRYAASKDKSFESDITAQLAGLKTDKQIYIRIHDSGDFYSFAYITKWFNIAIVNPNVRFYAYTKSISMFKQFNEYLPENFDLIYSEGSKNDKMINKDIDRHASIFTNEVDLIEQGYTNASYNDLLATKWYNANNKIGLIFH